MTKNLYSTFPKSGAKGNGKIMFVGFAPLFPSEATVLSSGL